MTARPSYVETWKEIGRLIGRSDRWCRYVAHRSDPLPVYKVGGIVRLDLADFEDWLCRQRDRSIARTIESW